MSSLSELIERVEKARGPDREIDAEVMFDLFAKPVGQKDDGGPCGYLWPEDNPSWSFGIRFPGKDREWFASCRNKIDRETLLIERDGALVLMNSLRIPKLTASIDAALTLLPEGYDWSLFADNGSAMAGCQPASDDGCDMPDVPGATPALALVAACLKSRLLDAASSEAADQ
jgi:hypothetical protein